PPLSPPPAPSPLSRRAHNPSPQTPPAVGERGGGGRCSLAQPGQCRRAARLFELGPTPELLRDSKQVDRLIALEQADHRVEDLAVALLVEVGGLEQLDRLGKAIALEKDGA